MPEIDLDQLEARADLVNYESSASTANTPSESESQLSSGDRELASYAAVRPSRAKRPKFEPQKPTKDNEYDSDDDGDFDPRQYDMQYLDSARQFLVNDHLETFNGMISRWEANHSLEEGDDIDSRTGEIVENHGHLRALNAQRNRDLASFFAESESEEEEEENVDQGEDLYDSDYELMASEARRDGRPMPVRIVPADDDVAALGADSLYTACEDQAPSLDYIVQSSTNKWIL